MLNMLQGSKQHWPPPQCRLPLPAPLAVQQPRWRDNTPL